VTGGDGSASRPRPFSPSPADDRPLIPGAPPARRFALRRGEPRPHRARRGFLAGVGLMAGSFLVYPAYPLLVLWPASDRARIEVTLVAAAVSWALFSVGLYLAGKRGWVWLRRRWKGRAGRSAPPPPAAPPC
jgi:hypothetical protein